MVHVTSDMYLPVDYDAAGNRIGAVTNLGLTVGVLPFKTLNMEVGLDHKSGLGLPDDHPLDGNLKIGVPEGAFSRVSPAVAVGVFDVGTQSDLTDFNVFYAKLAKSLTVDDVTLGRVSVGCFAGNEKLLVGRDDVADGKGLLLAWERTLRELSEKLDHRRQVGGGLVRQGATQSGYDLGYENRVNLCPLVSSPVRSNPKPPRRHLTRGLRDERCPQ